MTTISHKPNKTLLAFYVSASLILILVAVVYLINSVIMDRELRLGSCRMTTELALTDGEKAKGLAGRSEIAANLAMVFPFDNEKPLFWMKGRLVPIDIVWVDGDTVVAVDQKLPADDGVAHYYPPSPIDWVVEVAAGRAAACGVEKGTKIYGLTS